MNTSTTAPSPPTLKAAMRAQWDACARGWDAHTAAIHAWLQPATDAMLSMAGVAPGMRVLDVAAGAGDQTIALARRVGPAGHVLATDLSPAILERARHRVAEAGCKNVETLVADGEALGVAPASFDAAVCRLGLMLFPEPLAALREIHRALRPGGALCALVFGAPQRNPCLAILMSTALKHAGLPPRDPATPGGLLSLGAPGRANALFEEAGFGDVATVAVDAVFRAPSVDHYLDFVRSAGSPVVQILAALGRERPDAAWAEMREKLSAFDTPDEWQGPNELLLTTGRRDASKGVP